MGFKDQLTSDYTEVEERISYQLWDLKLVFITLLYIIDYPDK
jgi:hypothetical protein